MAAQEIAELKAHIARLEAKQTHTTKDLSLVTLIPTWSGTSKSTSLSDFLKSVERSAEAGNWSDQNRVSLAILKLEDTARVFVETDPELQKKDLKWSELKAALQRRFKDPKTEQYHYVALHSAKQKPNEAVLAFADRCRMLAQKVTSQIENPEGQTACNTQVERMLLASFLSGLQGNIGVQAKIALPATYEDAVKIAVAVEQAETERTRNDNSFYLDRPQNGKKEPDKKGNSRSNRSPNNRDSKYSESPQQYHCWVCGKQDHFAARCPDRKPRGEGPGNSQYRERRKGKARDTKMGNNPKSPEQPEKSGN